jgi:hypothetical protein
MRYVICIRGIFAEDSRLEHMTPQTNDIYYVTSFEHFGGNTYSLCTWSTVAPKYENIPHCVQQIPIFWPLADKGGIVYYQPYITEAILIFIISHLVLRENV